MKVSSITRWLGLVGFFIIIGCASKATIDLRYHTVGVNIPPCTKSIAVVSFEDKRDSIAVGQKKDGQFLYGQPFVAEWISQALVKELKMSGCDAAYHEKSADFGTDYVITGEIKETFLRQESISNFAANMKLKIVIHKGKTKVLGKEYSSTLSKSTVPTSGAYSEVLSELLQGMMREVVPDVRENLK